MKNTYGKNAGRRSSPGWALIIGLAVLLSACAGMGPTPEQLAAADYGAPVSQQEAVEMVKAYFYAQLEDPESTQYDWGQVKKDWMRDPQVNNGEPMFGYALDVQVNTRNTLGRYTGKMSYKFMFRNGRIRHIINQPLLSNDVTYMGKIY